MNAVTNERQLDNLTLLDAIEEPACVELLTSRFSSGQVYTWVGDALCAVNPYRLLAQNDVPLYAESVMDSYRGRTPWELPPHTFAVAESAYSALLRYRQPQALIISGESGSGKTEATKQALAFVARVAGGFAQAAQAASKAGGKAAAQLNAAQLVTQRIVLATVLTEAFGNAATVRNANSSRFGKLISLLFRPSGVLVSGSVDVYLLEKGRVVRQAGGERNYHILHQLTSGADAGLRSKLHIGLPASYAYLSYEDRKIEGANDAAGFSAVQRCFASLGISQERQLNVWRMLAAVLALGNIEFTSETEKEARAEAEAKEAAAAAEAEAVILEEGGGGGSGSSPGGVGTPSKGGGTINAHAARVTDEPASQTALAHAAELLGVAPQALTRALTTRTLQIRGGAATALNTPVQARNTRDSLAKAIYNACFVHVIGLINESISGLVAGGSSSGGGAAAAGGTEVGGTGLAKTGSASGTPEPKSAASPDASDTSGAVDTAQAVQEAAAAAEDVNLTTSILDLYGFEDLASDASGGSCNCFSQLLINYVNEKLQALYINAVLCAEQAVYQSEGIEWTPVPYFDNQVVVDLLAGKGGVMPLLDDTAALGEAASDSKALQLIEKAHAKHAHFLAAKVGDGTFTIRHYAGDITYKITAEEGMVAANRDALGNGLVLLLRSAKACPTLAAGFEDKRPPEERAKRPPTAGFQFRQSVDALVARLQQAQPHYIRCIKPNSRKAALTVEPDLFLHQFKYLGLLEAARVRRAGFSARMTYPEFLGRYRMLTAITWPPRAEDPDAKTHVTDMLAKIKIISKPRDKALAVGLGVGGGEAAGSGAAKAKTGGGSGRSKGGGSSSKGGKSGAKAGASASKKGSGGGGGSSPAPAQFASSVLPGDVGGPGSYALTPTMYQLGASMVFLKEPSLLFDLEYMRIMALGKVVSKVAALWRAHAGKRAYARIKAAWYKTVTLAKAWVARRRFKRMRIATVIIQAAVRGWLVRRSPAATALREGLGLMSYHGKVRRRASMQWATPVVVRAPPGTRDADVEAGPPGGERYDWLGVLGGRDGTVAMPGTSVVLTGDAPVASYAPLPVALTQPRAIKLMKALAKYHAKNDALDAADGWSLGGSAGSHTTPADQPFPGTAVLYMDHVIKVKADGSLRRRTLVVTPTAIFNVDDPWDKGRVNRVIRIGDLTGVTVSPHRDCYVLLSEAGERSGKAYDYLMVAQTKVSLLKTLEARWGAIQAARAGMGGGAGGAGVAPLGGTPAPVTGTPVPAAPAVLAAAPAVAPFPLRMTGATTFTLAKGEALHPRTLRFVQVPDASVFTTRTATSDEVKLRMLPGGVGGWEAVSSGGGGEAASAPTSLVLKAYLEAEKNTPFHIMAKDPLTGAVTMTVSIPVPRKVSLSEIITAAERDKLERLGIHGKGKGLKPTVRKTSRLVELMALPIKGGGSGAASGAGAGGAKGKAPGASASAKKLPSGGGSKASVISAKAGGGSAARLSSSGGSPNPLTKGSAASTASRSAAKIAVKA